jgi:hypothetical protein
LRKALPASKSLIQACHLRRNAPTTTPVSERGELTIALDVEQCRDIVALTHDAAVLVETRPHHDEVTGGVGPDRGLALPVGDRGVDE